MFPEGWKAVLKQEYLTDIQQFLKSEKEAGVVLSPRPSEIFRAFETDLDRVRVVIIGQDPYPNLKDAGGLAFSARNDRPVPASLKNIFREISRSFGIPLPPWQDISPDLTHWAHQGVFLLNTSLTTRVGERAAHAGKWVHFIRHVLRGLSQREKPIVFLLWGSHAQGLRSHIIDPHVVLEAKHPSPMTTGFIGCNHFVETNKILTEWGDTPVNWIWKLKRDLND